MQDRLKFRVWHKPLKIMHYDDFVITATGYVAPIQEEVKGIDYMIRFNQQDLEFDKQCVVMQCTGLKDKNGKLIYEGDIISIRCRNLTKHQISEVFYDKDRAAFCYRYYTDYGATVPCTMEKTEIEIIGNKYENPELLKGGEECL